MNLIKSMNTLLLSFLFLLTFSPQVFAHPHSFIDMETTLVTENHTLTGIEYVWKMDPMTSADILYDLMNSKEDSPQWKKQAASVMANIIAQFYFSELSYQNKKQPFKLFPDSYRMTRQGLQIVMSFRVSLLHPIPLAGSTIELKTYEPTFFVSMTYNGKRAVHLSPPDESQCRLVFTEADPSDSLKDYALSLDTGDTPDDDLTLGRQFAQQITLHCAE
ncbi:DUF1007 family protein [Morganella morganii]|uniref:DUF1007 family protein n=1 Tax=Morganella morganii TaxID=582 RepID=UPI00069A52C6|nr:DUF1007 family protein [Morganella morganii]